MKYQISWDLKSGKNALGLMQARGNDLVKAMKAHGDAKRQGNQFSDAVKRGIETGYDAFAQDMITETLKKEELQKSQQNIQDGIKLLQNVKTMLTSQNGLQRKIRGSQALWASMTETGRELQNSDLKKILTIRTDIEAIFDMCKNLRHNGTSVFGSVTNINQSDGVQGSLRSSSQSRSAGTAFGRQGDTGAPYTSTGLQGVMHQGNGRGAVIDFGFFYSDLKQNLLYIRENVSSYSEKGAITQRFRNCDLIITRAIRYCDETRDLFSNVNGGLRFSEKKTDNKIKSLVTERQNEMTQNAIVGILNGQNGVNLGGVSDSGFSSAQGGGAL